MTAERARQLDREAPYTLLACCSCRLRFPVHYLTYTASTAHCPECNSPQLEIVDG